MLIRPTRTLFLAVLIFFLPNELTSARYVPAADPPTLVANIPALATITVYVPYEAAFRPTIYLHRINPDGTLGAKLGALRDDGTSGDQTAGDKLFSLQLLLNEPAAGHIPFRIAVYNSRRGLPRARMPPPRTTDFSILVVTVPEITTPAEYNQVVDDLFTSAFDLRTTVQALFSPDLLEPDENLKHGRLMTDGLLTLYTNLEAIRRFESSTGQATQTTTSAKNRIALRHPTEVGFLLDLINGFLKEGNDSAKILTAGERFIEDGNNPDPDVVKIREWALETGCLEEHQFEGDVWRSDRVLCDEQFRIHNKYDPTARSLGKIGIKAAAGQATSLAGQGLGEIFNLGVVKAQALKGFLDEAFGQFIDFFTIPEANAQGLLLAEVEPGETIQVPAGQSDFIYAFGGDTPRARVSGVTVPTGETVEVSFSPGETLDFNPPAPPSAEVFVGDWTGNNWAAERLAIRIQGSQFEVRATLGSSFLAFGLRLNGYDQLPEDLGPRFTPLSDAEDSRISVSWDLPQSQPHQSQGPNPQNLRFEIELVSDLGGEYLLVHVYLNHNEQESTTFMGYFCRTGPNCFGGR